jgi:hypothetical protein
MALATEPAEAANIWVQLNRPVIDVDGRYLECRPVVADDLRQAPDTGMKDAPYS